LNKNVVLTGSTGWLGSETIEILDFTDRVIAYSSSRKFIKTSKANIHMKTKVFPELESISTCEGFINLAFLTRDKISQFSNSEYRQKNLDLIAQACELINTYKPKWIVLVSSGAVLNRQTKELESDFDANPYGFLKRFEEQQLKQAADSVGANIVIGRLWGATGRHMKVNRAFAISDFICQAKESGIITVESKHAVYRRYCDAGQFMQLLVLLAKSGEDLVIDSGGELIEIHELGQRIANLSNSKFISDKFEKHNFIDDYYSRSNRFELLAKQHQIPLLGIDQQIENTMAAHNASEKRL
jgi:nucleoside-diphosphate-sugar epimerase